MSKPTLGYWSIRGRGDSARMLLHHLGVDFEDKRWTLGDEGPDSWPAQKSKLGMIVPNLPYWKDGDIYHAELLAVLRSICRKYKPDYLGRNVTESGSADAFADTLYGKLNGWLGPYFMAADYRNKMEEGSGKIRELLNAVMNCKGNNKFLCGSQPTYTDFVVNWGIRIFKLYNDACVSEFPKIVEYHSAYLALPGIEAGNKAQSDMLDFPPSGWQADNMPGSVNKSHQQMATYKAYAATEAGAKLTLIDVPIPELGADDVAIDVTHCGICHSDLSLIDGEWGPFSAFPEQVSGHEAVGVITAVGANVTELAIGGIVGVGWQKGSCMMCAYCLKDEGECCTGPTGMIPTCAGGNKGGFAQKLNCHWKYAIPLPGPDVIPSEYLGPLMCGGITAYKPLVDFSKPGDRVGVVGLGGIGCMGVQLAKARDCHVTVFSRSEAKRAQAMEIGADAYIAMSDADQVAAAASSIDMILYTPNQCPDLMPYISCLAMKGKMAFIGAILAPPALPLFGPPIMKDLVFAGSHIGGPKLLKELVDLVVSKNVRIPVHVHPFEEIDQCLDKMRAVDHNGRFVLKW